MRGKTDHVVFENVIKELGGSGGMAPPPPRKILKYVLQMVHYESIYTFN